MHRRLMFLAAGALLALVASPLVALAADSSVPAFGGPLDGGQEVPPVATAATGEGTVVISADDSTITYVVTYSGLSGTPTAAHIHVGAAGVNGGVLLPLVAGPSPMIGTLTAADLNPGPGLTFAEAVTALKTGGAYFNVHTAANPAGEIRGQINAKGDAYFTSLAGFQEVPAVSTSASGDGWVVISTGGDEITYSLAHSDLSGAPAAAHIHLGPVGTNGGVLFPLAAGTNPMTGVLTASDLTPTGSVSDMAAAIAAIAAGGTYFNVHTAANPGGEIRGQIGEAVAPPQPTAEPTVPPTATVPVEASPTSGSGAAGAGLLLVAALAAAGLVARRAEARSGRRA